MDLDDIREILYAYTKELGTFLDEYGQRASDLDESETEDFVEEFLNSHEDLLGDVEAEQTEESY